jgi:hypothetical protein
MLDKNPGQDYVCLDFEYVLPVSGNKTDGREKCKIADAQSKLQTFIRYLLSANVQDHDLHFALNNDGTAVLHNITITFSLSGK